MIYFLYYVSFLFFGFALRNPLVRKIIVWEFGQGQEQYILFSSFRFITCEVPRLILALINIL